MWLYASLRPRGRRVEFDDQPRAGAPQAARLEQDRARADPQEFLQVIGRCAHGSHRRGQRQAAFAGGADRPNTQPTGGARSESGAADVRVVRRVAPNVPQLPSLRRRFPVIADQRVASTILGSGGRRFNPVSPPGRYPHPDTGVFLVVGTLLAASHAHTETYAGTWWSRSRRGVLASRGAWTRS